MKKIHLFAILISGMIFASCEKVTPDEIVSVLVKNNSVDSLIVSFNYKEEVDIIAPVQLDTLLPRESRQIVSLAFNHYHSHLHKDIKNSIRSDVFTYVIINCLHNKQLIITSLLGDTLANWNDNSVVFTDRNYWTIESMKRGTEDMDFDCTLDVTDEVLKLK